jgi:hypothetical protein
MIHPTPHEPQGSDVEGAEQPLAAPDRDAERDQARADHELDRFLGADPGYAEDLLGGRQVGHRERRATDAQLVRA